MQALSGAAIRELRARYPGQRNFTYRAKKKDTDRALKL